MDINRDEVLNIINEDFINELKIIVNSKRRLYISYIVMEYASHIFLFTSAIMIFASGFYSYNYLKFISGILIVLVYASNRLANSFNNEFNERNKTIANSLKSINITNEPLVIIEQATE